MSYQQFRYMSFLTLRQQVDNWTLQEDDQFFKTVQSLSEAIFESERQINQKISDTKYSLSESQITLGFNFNHFLRISELKFTENKIEERVQRQVEKVELQAKVQKPKMDLMRQALSMGLKNLDIKQEEAEKDNVSIASVSEYSFSMSQAVFKNTRLPPLFGTKQFMSKPFLNLYTEEDAQEINNEYRRSMSSSHIIPSGDLSRQSTIDLLPPPSLDEALKQSMIVQDSNDLPQLPRISQILNAPTAQPNPSIIPTNIPSGPAPPPPALNLPPPPPPPSLSESFIGVPPPEQPKLNLSASFTERPITIQQIQPQPTPHIKKALSFQQQLNLRLAKGKNYKQFATIKEEENEDSKIIEAPEVRKLPQEPIPEPIIATPIQPAPAPYRESVSYKEIANLSSNRFGDTKSNSTFQEQQQEENPIFGKKNKNKKKEEESKQSQQNERRKEEEKKLMTKTTFNEQSLFKKKPAIPSVLMGKKQPQKKNIFQNESQQEDVGLTRLQKKTKEVAQTKPAPIKIESPEKPKPLAVVNPSEITSPINQTQVTPVVGPKQAKPQPAVVKPEIKQVKVAPAAQKIAIAKPAEKKKNLFQDEDEDTDFIKKKKQQKPKQVKKAPVAKKNLLLADDSDDDFIKKKPLPKIPEPKAQSPSAQEKKPIVVPTKVEPIRPEPVPVEIERKPEPVQAPAVVKPQPIAQKEATAEPHNPNPSQQQPSDGSLIRRLKKKSNIRKQNFEDDDEEPALRPSVANKLQAKQQIKRENPPVEIRPIQKSSIKVIGPLGGRQEETKTESEFTGKKDPKKIAGIMMGMGMGPLIPTGMVLSKPSQVKAQEKLAQQRLQQEKKQKEQAAIRQAEQQKNTQAKYAEELNRQQQYATNLKRQQQEKQRKSKLQQNDQRQLMEQQEQQRLQRQQVQRQRREKEDRQRAKRQADERQRQQQVKIQNQRREEVQKREREENARRQRQESIRIQNLQKERQQRQRIQKQRREKQEKERLEREEYERRIIEQRNQTAKEEQLRKEREREELQRRKQAEQRRRQQEEYQQRLRQQQEQRQQQQRIRRQREQYERRVRQENQRRERQEYERRVRQQNERRERQERERRQREQYERRQREQALKRQREQNQRRRKEQQQTIAQQKKAQQSNLIPKLPSKPLPGLPGTNQLAGQKPKKTLFDDQDDKPLVQQKKVVEKKPAAKKNLFDDDEDDMNFKPKAKVDKKPVAKKNLFEDDDDMPMPVKSQSKQQEKPKAKQQPKKNLFDDDDDNFSVPQKKQPTPSPQAQPVIVKQQSKKKNLFDEDDSPAPIIKQSTPVRDQSIKQQPKVTVKIQPKPAPKPQTKKKNLFDQDEEQIKPAKKFEQPKKANLPPTAIQKKNLFDEEDDSNFIPKKSVPVKESAPISQPSPKLVEPVKGALKADGKKTGIFDDQDDTPPPTVTAKQSAPPKNQSPKKKNLFDEEDDAPMIPKKQPAAKVEAKPAKKNLFDDDDDSSFAPPKKANPPATATIKPQPVKQAPKKNLFEDDDDGGFTMKKAPTKPSTKNKKNLFNDSD